MRTRGCLKFFIVLVAVFVIIVGGLAVYRLVSGESLGLISWVYNQVNGVVDRAQVVMDTSTRSRDKAQQFTNVIFLHHSVGNNLIEQGGVRELFNQAGYQFWDHDYNYIGLTDPNGNPTGYSYSIPADNTDPDGLHQLFHQPELPLPLNAFSGLMQHEVIIFKSCYPASDIVSEEDLQASKQMYLEIRDVMDQHPEKLFIVVTQPPLNPAHTTLEIANRARSFADWLKSDEYLAGHPNVATYDLFGQLAEDQAGVPDYNMLKGEYRQGTDSHPNEIANQVIAPDFVEFITQAIESYRMIADSRAVSE
jgi:hypothetical protein